MSEGKFEACRRIGQFKDNSKPAVVRLVVDRRKMQKTLHFHNMKQLKPTDTSFFNMPNTKIFIDEENLTPYNQQREFLAVN